MLREIIKPTSEFYTIHIPKEYINHEVEIFVLPFSYYSNDTKANRNPQRRSFVGALNKYANPSLIENEKEIAWEQVANDKNVLS